MTLFDLLQKRYPEKEYVIMEEVSDKSGFDRSRSADYVVVGLWPSRGLPINGIELKSSRSDWLRELKDPEKAENIFQYCDYFWLLTTDESIAKTEEIPPTWGWMCVKGEKIITKKEAPNLTPVPLSKSFSICMLRRAADKSKYVRVDSIHDKITEAKQAGKNESKSTIENLEKKLTELQTAVREFQSESGVDLIHYRRYETSPTKMGAALRIVQNGGAEPIKKELLQLQITARNIHELINKAIEDLKPCSAK